MSFFITQHLTDTVPSIAVWKRGSDRAPLLKLVVVGDMTAKKAEVVAWLQDLCREAEKRGAA